MWTKSAPSSRSEQLSNQIVALVKSQIFSIERENYDLKQFIDRIEIEHLNFKKKVKKWERTVHQLLKHRQIELSLPSIEGYEINDDCKKVRNIVESATKKTIQYRKKSEKGRGKRNYYDTIRPNEKTDLSFKRTSPDPLEKNTSKLRYTNNLENDAASSSANRRASSNKLYNLFCQDSKYNKSIPNDKVEITCKQQVATNLNGLEEAKDEGDEDTVKSKRSVEGHVNYLINADLVPCRNVGKESSKMEPLQKNSHCVILSAGSKRVEEASAITNRDYTHRRFQYDHRTSGNDNLDRKDIVVKKEVEKESIDEIRNWKNTMGYKNKENTNTGKSNEDCEDKRSSNICFECEKSPLVKKSPLSSTKPLSSTHSSNNEKSKATSRTLQQQKLTEQSIFEQSDMNQNSECSPRDKINSIWPIERCSNRLSSFKYKEVVRGKDLRRSLPAHTCSKCEAFMNAVCMGDEDRRNMIQECSRHRGKFSPDPNTPDGFWELSFADSVAKQDV